MMEEQNVPTPVQTTPPIIAQQPSKKSGMSWLMALVGLIIGAGVVGAAWLYWPKTTSPDSSNVSSSAACNPEELSMEISASNIAAGTDTRHVVLTNNGVQGCTLAGFPTVFLLDETGGALGSGATPVEEPAANQIVLAPGAKASAAVGLPQVDNFAEGSCSTDSSTMRVYLPGSASYLEAPLAEAWCPGFSVAAVVSGE